MGIAQNHVRRGADKFRRIGLRSGGIAGGEADIHAHVAAVDPAQTLHAILEGGEAGLPLRIVRDPDEHPDAPHPFRLLRPCRERPRCRAAEQRYKCAPLHVGPPPPESVCCTFSLPQGGRRVL